MRQESRPGGNSEAAPEQTDFHGHAVDRVCFESSALADKKPGSQQVSWWSVHEFVVPKLEKAGDWPLLGTPAWCSLDNSDPRKWAAVLDGGQHHALRLETAQEARAEAGRAIAGAADWPAIAREIHELEKFYAARPWLRRVVQ
jgi:hypothetical protein